MPDTTFNTFENEYAQAAALARQKIVIQPDSIEDHEEIQAQRLIDQQIEDGLDQELIEKESIRESLTNIGRNLGEQMQAGSFRAFIYCLSLAVFKDILDVVSVGWAGLISTWILGPLIFGILYSSHFRGIMNMVKRQVRKMIIKKALQKMIVTLLVEALPGVNILPMSSILILWLKSDSNKMQEKLRQEQKQVERIMKRV